MGRDFLLYPSLHRVLGLAVLFSSSCAASAFANNPIPQVVGPPVPQAVVPGSGTFTLKVYGANFVEGAVVNWNRQPRTTTFVSARELHAQILASDVAKATAGYITVTNPPPGGGVSSSSYAIVEVHVPTKTISVKQPGVYTDGGNEYLIAADFHGTGILDLVAGSPSGSPGGEVTLNRGNGDGTFQSAYTIGNDYADGDAAGIAFGDFNGDGKLDVVYGWDNNPHSGDPPSHLKVLLGKGHGQFNGLPHFALFPNDYPKGIVVGDFNRDGILDLAVASTFDYGAGLYVGKGDGTFKRIWNFYYAPGTFDAVGADFNGDGTLDIAFEDGHGLHLLLGNGDGTFQKVREIAWDKNPPGYCNGYGSTLLVNDFNGDGNADLAFCDRDSNGYVRIGIVLGNGDGTFQRPVYYGTGFGPQGVVSFAAGDFDSDGRTDLITCTPSANGQFDPEFKVFWGNGDGTFQRAKKITLLENAGGEVQLIPGDFNSDGLLDFVMANFSDLRVYIQK